MILKNIFQFGSAICGQNGLFRTEDFVQVENQYGASICLRKLIFILRFFRKRENQYGAAICCPNWHFFGMGAAMLRTSRNPY